MDMTAAPTQEIDWQTLQKSFGDRLLRKAALARYTSARVGGPADGLIEVNSSADMVKIAVTLWNSKTPFVIIGGGSNILVSDHGIRGVVVLNRARNIRFQHDFETPQVYAESGANFGAIARQAAQSGFSGLEWAAGIPGTLGGAVVGNAGAHGMDMSDNLLMAKILHHTSVIEDWKVEDFVFSYRSSRLKSNPKTVDAGRAINQSPRLIVLSAVLKLENSSPDVVQQKIDTYVAHRRRTQPPGASMGSMFKNPSGDYAGRLIEAAGLKGSQIGDAQISNLHANFFINSGQASAKEIRALIDLARNSVMDKFGIALELEIELLGEW